MKSYKVVHQFIKFAIVGVIGLIIDFGLLNLLSHLTHVTSGDWIIPINIVSFGSALLVSFFLNKRWTFEDFADKGTQKFSMFLTVALVGLLINTILVRLITDGHPMLTFSPRIWLNIAKGTATVVSGAWNFSGYKFWVFKK